jgi:hypothetical protein
MSPPTRHLGVKSETRCIEKSTVKRVLAKYFREVGKTRIKRPLPAQKVSCPSWQGEEPTSDSQVPHAGSSWIIQQLLPLQTADAAAKRKVRDYQRFFNIQQSNRSFSLLKRVGTRIAHQSLVQTGTETFVPCSLCLTQLSPTVGRRKPRFPYSPNTHLVLISTGVKKSFKFSLGHKKIAKYLEEYKIQQQTKGVEFEQLFGNSFHHLKRKSCYEPLTTRKCSACHLRNRNSP